MTTRTIAAAPATLADLFLPRTAVHAWLVRGAVVVSGAALIALSARIAFHLPFSPVPVTAQTFAVLLIAAALGSRMGSASVLTYLGVAAAGAPVLAKGMGGLPWMIGPSGGYLLGFAAAAFVVGRLAESGWDRRPLRTFAAMSIGYAIILALGWAWLAILFTPHTALVQGVLPFLPGAVIKSLLAIAVLPLAWKLVGSR